MIRFHHTLNSPRPLVDIGYSVGDQPSYFGGPLSQEAALPRSLMQAVLVTALAAIVTGCATTATGSLHAAVDAPAAVTPVIEPGSTELALADENGAPVLVAAAYRLDGAETLP